MTIGPLPTTSTQRGGSVPGPGSGAVRSTAGRLVPAAIDRNSSNTGARSWGPGAPSGWYCTEKAGRPLWRSPSTLPSLRLRSLTYQPDPSGIDPPSTWNSWFCEVTKTPPPARSWTGWLPPWWPNLSLDVVAPTARPSTWWPRQMPSRGTRRSSRAAQRRTAWGITAGSPGPLESMTPSGRWRRTSSRVASQGTSTTSAPRLRSARRLLRFTPRSTATIRTPAKAPVPPAALSARSRVGCSGSSQSVHGSRSEHSATRSWSPTWGALRARATCSPGRIAAAGPSTARTVPWSRRWRVRARVSTPRRPGTPLRRSSSSRLRSPRGWPICGESSRTTIARAHTRDDSASSSRQP